MLAAHRIGSDRIRHVTSRHVGTETSRIDRRVYYFDGFRTIASTSKILKP